MGATSTDQKACATRPEGTGRAWWEMCCGGCCLFLVVFIMLLILGGFLFSGPPKILKPYVEPIQQRWSGWWSRVTSSQDLPAPRVTTSSEAD